MILLDNTALSAFAHIDKLDIPSKLFGETFIPESVYYEGVLKAKKSERVDRIKNCIKEGLIKVIKPSKDDFEFANKLPATLGLGERYTIAIGFLLPPVRHQHERRKGIVPGRLSDIWLRGIAASGIDTPLEFGFMNCCPRQRMIRCYWIPSPPSPASPTPHPGAIFRGRIELSSISGIPST